MMAYLLKEHRNSAMLRWYRRNKKKHIACVKRRKDEIKAWIRGYKASVGCKRCEETNPDALDFHHKNDRDKSFRLHNCVNLFGFNQIRAEIAKCDIYCANCHRKYHKHWQYRGRITPIT